MEPKAPGATLVILKLGQEHPPTEVYGRLDLIGHISFGKDEFYFFSPSHDQGIVGVLGSFLGF